MDLASSSATALAQALIRGEISAPELLDATLARIDEVNPRLNAVVALDREGARVQAEASQSRLRSGTARPLEGLPITIKDAFDVAGIVSTAGATTFRERVPEQDAVVVARLRAAGAVIIGKTNVPPFSGDFQAANPVYGVTNNPWDVTRSPGGSSGGAAAAVATGMSAFEVGSDLGGSVRWPAHACGLYGLKPTWGLVSTRGHVPPAPGATIESDLTVAGPLARSAADLELVLGVIAGPAALDGARPHLAPAPVREPQGLRVALWSHDPFAPVQGEVRAAVERAADLLARDGALIDETARPAFSFQEAFETYALMNHAIVAAGLPAKIRDRLAEAARDLDPADRSHKALQARGARLNIDVWRGLQETRRRLKAEWAAFFQRFDVVLMPPAPVVAIPHDATPDIHARRLDIDGESRPYFDFLIWSSLATVAHLPAAVAPTLRGASGMPAGVQIVAAEGADRTALLVASMLEERTGGFQPPPV